ncbi:MAG: diguanylate cyclase [Gammaproteobacteria bacterium]|nr:diguanylate cyclase [Gammaproteobacteria bacterium]
MAKRNFLQHSFKTLLLKQLFLAIALSLAITVPIVSIPAYFVLKQNIATDIQQIEHLTYSALNDHLTTGWQPHAIDKVYQTLRNRLPNADFLLHKASPFLKEGEAVIAPTDHVNQLIEKVERDERLIIETQLFSGTINAAVPIVFNQSCLSCHSAQVSTGEVYVGALAGILVLQTPMSIEHIPPASLAALFILFLIIFMLVTTVITNRLVQKNLLSPLSELTTRVKRLRLTSHEQHIEWQRSPQPIIEIDEIDKSITDHILSIQHIYDKLDSLTVTEHESGLFHRERYHEVIRYELFRSHRYHRPFSLVLIKLVEVKVLNAAAKNIETEQPGSKYMVFGQILHNDSRESDLAFRLEEQIFAIIAPETNHQGAKGLEQDIYRRLTQSKIPAEVANSSIVLPEYQFTIQVGVATYESEHKGAKELMRQAVLDMRASKEMTGKYPPDPA